MGCRPRRSLFFVLLFFECFAQLCNVNRSKAGALIVDFSFCAGEEKVVVVCSGYFQRMERRVPFLRKAVYLPVPEADPVFLPACSSARSVRRVAVRQRSCLRMCCRHCRFPGHWLPKPRLYNRCTDRRSVRHQEDCVRCLFREQKSLVKYYVFYSIIIFLERLYIAVVRPQVYSAFFIIFA